MSAKKAELGLFHFESEHPSFDELGVANGTRTWKEADLMRAFGYAERGSFRKAIMRAMQACLSLGLPTEENFILDEGAYRLTRFGCYLVAMNADSKKYQVAAAQVYFATIAETFQDAAEHSEGIDRLLIREEMADGMKALGRTAKEHGVTNYALFQNAGYRGMYNMDFGRLKTVKGLPAKQTLLDRMGKVELAGNLFRVTQTEAKINAHNVQGQRNLENAAETVGREVREIMIANTGVKPERIPLAPPVQQVRKTLKGTNRKFKALDGGKKAKLKPSP